METIDTMQNGDIQQLRHPIVPITLSDSRATDDAAGRGRLALSMNESQLYTNEHGQLCLITPVQVNPAEVGEEGMPLTVDFERGMIRHGTKIFYNKTVPNLTGIAPVQIKNNKIGLRLSESFVLEGGLEGEENETSSLELKYPISVTGDLPSNPRAPLTFNFTNGEISRDDVKFPLANSNVTIEQISNSISALHANIQTHNVILYKFNNMLYLTGYVTLTSTSIIVPDLNVCIIRLPNLSIKNGVNGGIAPYTNSSVNTYFKFNVINSSILIKNIIEVPNAYTFTLNFSHIIGYI